jgi:hypothetical protein
MPGQPATIDRDKMRAALRTLGNEYIFYMLSDAIDMLPPKKLSVLAARYLMVDRLRPDVNSEAKADLLTAVQAFDKASRAGTYYQGFNRNSSNYREKSAGTLAFITEFERLIDRCVAEEKRTKKPRTNRVAANTIREAFDILFSLLDRIDECNDDIVFFADEGGAWQVGVIWENVLPPWFRLLSATVSPEVYCERITGLLERHFHYGRDKMLVVAHKTATLEQRAAMAAAGVQTKLVR